MIYRRLLADGFITYYMTYSKLPVIDDRLWSCASFVRPGSVICDVGTDHAYIPVYLVKRGTVPFAVATDINEGPLAAARKNADAYGVSNMIHFIKADGLQFENIEQYNISDILICGMGGELIRDIIGACPYTKNGNVRLILQPMTQVNLLRSFLFENGYEEVDGTVSESAGKIYQTIVCEYTGKNTSCRDSELYCGVSEGIRGCDLYGKLIDKYISKFTFEKEGRIKGSLDVSAEEKLICELKEIKEKL